MFCLGQSNSVHWLLWSFFWPQWKLREEFNGIWKSEKSNTRQISKWNLAARGSLKFTCAHVKIISHHRIIRSYMMLFTDCIIWLSFGTICYAFRHMDCPKSLAIMQYKYVPLEGTSINKKADTIGRLPHKWSKQYNEFPRWIPKLKSFMWCI